MTTHVISQVLSCPRRKYRWIALALQLLVLFTVVFTVAPKYLEVRSREPFQPTLISIEALTKMTTLPPLPQQRYITLEAKTIIDTGEGITYTYRRRGRVSKSVSRDLLTPAGTRYLLIKEAEQSVEDTVILNSNPKPEPQIRTFTGMLSPISYTTKRDKPILPMILTEGEKPDNPERFDAERGLAIAVIFLFLTLRTAYNIKKWGSAL
jgi:hypothetical protein